jgi:sec-independent protein translocase protein TatA
MFGNFNPFEMMLIMGIAVLLFGKRLPEVGRSLGRGIMEFKKSFRGVEDELRSVRELTNFQHLTDPTFTSSSTPSSSPASVEPAVPKFTAPGASPVPIMEYEPQPGRD